MNEQAIGVINELLTSLLCAVISAAAAYAMLLIAKAKAKFQAEINKIQSDKNRMYLSAGLDELDRLATVTVRAMEQTVAKDLRAAIKKGGKGVNAKKEQLASLAVQSAGSVYEQLKPEYKAFLEANMSNLEGYIAALIESKVYDVKSTAATTEKPPP